MKLIKKAAAVSAAAAMVLSLSACGSNLSWAAKIGDDVTVPIGLYIYSQAANYRTAVESGTLSSYTELSEQTVTVSGSDVSAFEYLDDEALKSTKSYVGALLMSEDMGLTLSDEEIASAVESAAGVYETDEDVMVKNGVAQSSIEEYYKSVACKSNLFQALYGEEGTKPVSDDELKAYFAENYATLNFMQQYFYNEDGSYMSDEEIAALKKEYESIKSKVESGKLDFVKKCKEFAANATSYSGAYTDSTSRFDPVEDANIMGLKAGELTLIVTDSVIALVQKTTLDKDGSKFEQYHDTLLMEYKYNDFIDELIQYAESSDKVKFNDKAFEKFSASTRDYSDLSISSYY